MSKASQGLQSSLARLKGGVVAIGEMSVDDILANMSDEQRTALNATMASQAAAAAPVVNAGDPPAGSSEGDGEGQGDGNDGGDGAAANLQPAAQPLASNASIHARVQAVASAEGIKGKEAVALAMLADDEFAGLSATAIVKLVGQAGAPAASGDDADRSTMAAALAQSRNSGVDADGGKVDDTKKQSAGIWDKAIARINPGQTS